MSSGFRLSGPGIAGRRHGRRPRGGLCHRPGRLRRSRRGAEAKPLQTDAGRAGKRADPDRKRPAGADGRQRGGGADPREGRRQAAIVAGLLCCGPLVGRILGPGRGRCAQTCRCRAPPEAARPVDAEGGAGRRWGDGRPARHRARARAGGLQGSRPGRSGGGGQRQWRRPGRRERPQGGRRAYHRSGQGTRGASAACCCR